MQSKLKTAVLGLKDAPAALLEAAVNSDYFQIQAVADKDTRLAEEVARRYDCTPFDDYRQLVIQNQLDCLLVTAGLHACDEYVRAAMKKKFHVLKLPPLARSFAEAVELVDLARREDVKFAIANSGRFAAGFLELQKLLEQGLIEQLYLITAHCSFPEPLKPAWRTDPRLAGGGVLLRDCYDLIDRLICTFGLPQKVYALVTNHAPDRQQRLYLTENTAVVTMKFTDTLIANLIASAGPADKGPRETIKFYTADKTLTLSDNHLVICDDRGHPGQKPDYKDDQPSRMKKMLENFALSILSPDNNKLLTPANHNLSNMAVIESAYLSARTAMPEAPEAILQMTAKQPP